ncbi:uncharacterized protein BXZ73DRAFT_78860 [Epithele typhae]|uniref:uncharacterized protein n=1 Tax=Epithele typhae TaxID=378194 RepID=UPI0020076F12|nr:uncharacterized protein BXZ73DRAFT_78860 [Epithele typhae]KAH9925878.1 hypothetical protein BXZ73DRAFT_78860 [Epithele typhae]
MESDRLARACGQGPVLASHSASSSPLQAARTIPAPEPTFPSHLILAPASKVPAPEPSPALRSSKPWEHPESASIGGPWTGRIRARSVRAGPRKSPSPCPPRPRASSQPAVVPVSAPSNPRSVLWSLREVLEQGGDERPLDECLDVQRVLDKWAAHQKQTLWAWRGTGAEAGLDPRSDVDTRIFGAPVSVAIRRSSMVTVLGGYQHPIPWVVYACVEELNRTGIYQPGLFRSAPHRGRLAKLIAEFDSPASPASSSPPSGQTSPAGDSARLCPPPLTPTSSCSSRTSLRKESTADIGALLKKYLDEMPEPLLDENLVSALHEVCVVPTLRQQESSAATTDGDGDMQMVDARTVCKDYFSVPSGSSSEAHRAHSAPPFALSSHMLMTPSERQRAALSAESTQVAAAQHLLRLAPPPQCVLFAYLLAFFTQLPLSPDNGLTLDDVARMFGRSLAGGPLGVRSAVLMWILERWARVSDGLFDITFGEDAGEDEPHPDLDLGVQQGFNTTPEGTRSEPISRAFTASPIPVDASIRSPSSTTSPRASLVHHDSTPRGDVHGSSILTFCEEDSHAQYVFPRAHSDSVSTSSDGSASTGDSEGTSHELRTPFSADCCSLPAYHVQSPHHYTPQGSPEAYAFPPYEGVRASGGFGFEEDAYSRGRFFASQQQQEEHHAKLEANSGRLGHEHSGVHRRQNR